MSTILRALRRLEQESASEETVELQDRVVAPTMRPARTLLRVWVVVAAAFMAAGLGALLSWQLGLGARSETKLGSVTAARPPDSSIPVSPLPVAAAPRQVAPAVRQPIAATDPLRAVEIVPEKPDTVFERLPVISPEVVVEDRGPVPGLLEPDLLDPPEKPDPLELAVASIAGEAVDVPSAEVATDPEMAPVGAPAPVFQAAVSDVFVTQTTWHPDPERRSAVVEVEGSAVPLDVHEGDRVGGMLLVRIKPSGVIFERDGVEIDRRVGGR